MMDNERENVARNSKFVAIASAVTTVCDYNKLRAGEPAPAPPASSIAPVSPLPLENRGASKS